MWIYIIIALCAFALGELTRRIRLYFGKTEVNFTNIKISALLFLISFIIPSFGLFTFSTGLIAHNLIKKEKLI